jgi:modulator of FtsH protease HflC
MNSKIVIGLLLALFVLLGTMSAYTVDETQQVVVTRFGKVIQTVKEPGLKFKWPIVDRAIFYPRNLQEWDGDPGEIPTKDKTYIYVDTFARWKIVDPVLFFKTIRTPVELATNRLNEIIDPAVRNEITSNRLIESVRNSNRELDTFELGLEDNEQKKQRKAYAIKVGRREITAKILEEAQAKLEKFGIELLDVEIKRLNYTEEVRQSVYDRMIAERKQIAQKFRSEGKISSESGPKPTARPRKSRGGPMPRRPDSMPRLSAGTLNSIPLQKPWRFMMTPWTRIAP